MITVLDTPIDEASLRRQFAYLFSTPQRADYSTLNEALDAIRMPIWRAAYEEAHPKAFKSRGRFRLKGFDRLQCISVDEALWDSLRPGDEELAKEWHGRRKIWLHARADLLEQLAADLTPKKSEAWNKAGETSSTTYDTQGYGAAGYADRAAEGRADHFRAQGLAARVVRVPVTYDHGHHNVGWTDYHIEVQAESLDIEIARLRPGLSLREHVALIWLRGGNPRVGMPMLDRNFERDNGLDYFGRINGEFVKIPGAQDEQDLETP